MIALQTHLSNKPTYFQIFGFKCRKFKNKKKISFLNLWSFFLEFIIDLLIHSKYLILYTLIVCFISHFKTLHHMIIWELDVDFLMQNSQIKNKLSHELAIRTFSLIGVKIHFSIFKNTVRIKSYLCGILKWIWKSIKKIQL